MSNRLLVSGFFIIVRLYSCIWLGFKSTNDQVLVCHQKDSGKHLRVKSDGNILTLNLEINTSMYKLNIWAIIFFMPETFSF